MFHASESPIKVDDPSPHELKLVAALSPSQIQSLDDLLLSSATQHWRKVAMVVGSAMSRAVANFNGITELYFAQRVRVLAEQGQFESQGNLRYLRFSEVRLPAATSSGSES